MELNDFRDPLQHRNILDLISRFPGGAASIAEKHCDANLRGIQGYGFRGRSSNQLMKRGLGYGKRQNWLASFSRIAIVTDLRDTRDTPRSGTFRFLLRAHHDFRRTLVDGHLVDGRLLDVIEYLLRQGLRYTPRSAFESTIRRDAALQIVRRYRLSFPIGLLRRVFAAGVAAIQRLYT